MNGLPLKNELDEMLRQERLAALVKTWVSTVEDLPFEDYELSMAKSQVMTSLYLLMREHGWKYKDATISLIDGYLAIKTEDSKDTQLLYEIKSLIGDVG